MESSVPTDGESGGDRGAATPEAVEEVLARCIERARAAGKTIIHGAYTVDHPVLGTVGCCAIGASDLFPPASPLGLSHLQEIDLVLGFDQVYGTPETEWYAVGARLRARYQPVPASSIGSGS